MLTVCDDILEMNNISKDLERECIRSLCNKIGADDEWVEKGYHKSIGLDRK